MSLFPSSQNANDHGSAPIDLRRVRTLFAQAQRVAASNFLRREVASRMHERLALVKINPHRMLDAGCGEGADLPLLKQRFNTAHLVGIDAAFGMLQAGRQQQNMAQSSVNRLLQKILPLKKVMRFDADMVNANFAHLPFGVNTFDVVWSNLALHWHPQPDSVFAEWRRILRVDGLLMFSCFGPDTFKELRMAFSGVEQVMRILPFVDMHDYGDMLGQTGFSAPVMDMEAITVTYDSVANLMADVRAFGGNPLVSRPAGLMGRSRWENVVRNLEKMRRPDGKIPLTFEVIYGHAFRPVPKQTSSGETIIRLDMPFKKR